MLNANAQKLVTALRSGEYKQIQGTLEAPEGNCCLGVACRVFNEENPGVLVITQDYYKLTSFSGCFNILPCVVRDWLGFVTTAGTFSGKGISLLDLNDNGASFAEIATFIESEPDGLFVEEINVK